MKYYYADAKNQPAGPVSIDELKRLLATGLIAEQTNVIPEGSTVWVPLASVLALSRSGVVDLDTPPEGSGLLAQIPTVLADRIGKILEKARELLSLTFLQKALWFLTIWGQALVVLGAVLGLVCALVLAIKHNEFRLFLFGLGGVFAIAVLQYVAKRFLQGCFTLVKVTPSSMASPAVLDCFALIQLIAAICLLLRGIILAIQINQFAYFVQGLLGSLACALTGGVSLNPRIANIDIKPASAGEEAMGVVSFLLKLPLVVLPASFFALAFAAVVMLIAALFGGHMPLPLPESIAMWVPQSDAFGDELAGIAVLVFASVLPFFTYLGFLLGYLAVDVIRSIVSLPGKLDALKK